MTRARTRAVERFEERGVIGLGSQGRIAAYLAENNGGGDR